MTTTSARRLWNWSLACACLLAAGIAFAAAQPALAQEKAAKQTSCVACHSDARFLVQNKKLYDYYQGWRLSVHAINDVSCVSCHGGDPQAKDKDKAHGAKGLGSSAKSSPINYRNIPDTCARCHKKVAAKFRESQHYKHLVANKDGEQGPSCVTCHGSVNTSVLTVNTVRNTCSQCHNEKTRNNPDIPGEAEAVLNNFLSINRYYRAIASRSTPEEAKSFSNIVDPMIESLNADWHSFDLDLIGERTHDLVEFMKVRRQNLKQKSPANRRRQ